MLRAMTSTARQPKATPYRRALFWFRRDLRDYDNAGLYYALKSARQVYCVFVFDREILDELPDKADRRVEFILESVRELDQSLRGPKEEGGGLIVLNDNARDAIPRLAAELDVDAVFTNRDYEPQAIARDAAVEEALAQRNIVFHTAKDTVIFEQDEVLTQSGTPFSVFTPYKNAWQRKLNESGDFYHRAYPVEKYRGSLARPPKPASLPTLADLGFEATNLHQLGVKTGMNGAAELLADFRTRIEAYREARDYPAVKGVSYLSVHNRFGTVSIRELTSIALAESGPGAQTWLSELIWRDFYFQILFHHPRVARTAFKPEYDAIRWPNDKALFAAWCEGRTGYPIVDAAMRQLNTTGYMHNRLRMIVASFLTKDLHVDWRWGEKYFADRLIDFDLASNNGGWQWAASTGCDAQPYFRIFNPVTQSERFDPRGKFIRRYVTELAGLPDKCIHAPWLATPPAQEAAGCIVGRDYPSPVVDHARSRERALGLYSIIKS
jgi:deoxyribodipyrimidine photo-lyase